MVWGRRRSVGVHVTAIHPTVSGPVTKFTTVYVDISCPPSNN
jgi:hypothetical protein